MAHFLARVDLIRKVTESGRIPRQGVSPVALSATPQETEAAISATGSRSGLDQIGSRLASSRNQIEIGW